MRFGVVLMNPRKLIVLDAKHSVAAARSVAERFGKAVYDASGYNGTGALREQLRVDEATPATGEYDIEPIAFGGDGFGLNPHPPVTVYNEHHGISQGIGWDDAGMMTWRGVVYDMDLTSEGEVAWMKPYNPYSGFRVD